MPSLRILALASLIALAAPFTAFADRLVNPGAPTFASTGTETVAFDGYVYFAANDDVHGTELWRTDGTAGGTTLVRDFNVGNASSHSNPRALTVVGNRMFVTVTDTLSQLSVYTIDPGGTPQATTVAAGAFPDSPTSGGTLLGSVGGKALLGHYDGVNYKLYSLGQSGSVFAQISAGNVDVTSQTATAGGYAFFSQSAGPSSGNELWRTDGTTTQLVKDILPGISSSVPTGFFATGNRVYFTANDGFHGTELWVTDGTDPGTALVHEHHSGTTGTSVDIQAANGNTLFYVPNDPATGTEVWRTDGTDAGTRVVKDVTPGVNGSTTKVFAFASGFGMLRGGEVYGSDGTAAGTTLLGAFDNDGYGPDFPRTVGSRAYFRGGFSPYGSVIWRTDGTPTGTFALTAGPFDGVTAGNPDAGPVTQLGTKLIFTAQYPHATGDPVSASARRIYVLDTAQADETRRATAAPSIAGTAAVGQKLTGAKGTWTLEPNTFTYQWLRNGTAIPNATTTDYTPVAADAGTQLRFRVTAAGIGGPNKVAADSAPATVAGAGPPPGATPALTVLKKTKLIGKPRVGRRLTLALPKFTQTGVTLAFRWYAGGTRIKNQSKPSLKLTKALKGKRITVKVIATKPGYTTLTLKLGPSGKVRGARG
jgi:ELWxxDGT repeat protein